MGQRSPNHCALMTPGTEPEVLSGQLQQKRTAGEVPRDPGRFGLSLCLGTEIAAGCGSQRLKEGPRTFEAIADVGGGEDAEVSDLHEALGEQVLEEAADEFGWRSAPRVRKTISPASSLMRRALLMATRWV